MNEGVVVSRSQGHSNTHVIKKLENFAGFLFVTDWGQTMMGGNDVKVWYHSVYPAEINPDTTLPVLHVYYQGGFNINTDCVVKNFNEDGLWQTAIEQAIKRKRGILKQLLNSQKDLKNQKDTLSENLTKRSLLEREAKRLGI